MLSDPQKRSQYDQFGTTFGQARAGGGFSGFEGFRDFSSFADAFDFFGGRAQRGGRSQSGNRENFGFEDIFEGLFGGRASNRTQRGAGQDIGVDLEITLAEAYAGVEKEIDLYKNIICSECRGAGAAAGSKLKRCLNCRGQGQVEERRSGGFFTFSQIKTCSACQGTGEKAEKECLKCRGAGRLKENKILRVKIPAGIQDGQVIGLTGQGEAGRINQEPGDLYITVHVKPDSRFQREGDNLIYDLPINFSQAALGGKIEVPTLAGWVNLKIPEGVESGAQILLEEKGMPRLNRRGFGDMIVKVKVKTPKKLSRRAKDLLEEFKKEIM